MVSPMSEISPRVSTRLREDSRTADYSHNIEVAADRGMSPCQGKSPARKSGMQPRRLPGTPRA